MADYNKINANDSLLKQTDQESTPQSKTISVKKRINDKSASFLSNESPSSTPDIPMRESSVEEKMQLADELSNGKKEYDQLIKKLENDLIISLESFAIESEAQSKAEEMICGIANEFSMRVLGEVITGVYIKCYHNQKAIAGICYSLERYDSQEVYPWGQSIVLGLVNHKSEIVKERVISLIENWGDISLVLALKNMDISSTWMEKYVNNVITYLERKNNVLCEKAV